MLYFPLCDVTLSSLHVYSTTDWEGRNSPFGAIELEILADIRIGLCSASNGLVHGDRERGEVEADDGDDMDGDDCPDEEPEVDRVLCDVESPGDLALCGDTSRACSTSKDWGLRNDPSIVL